MAKGDETQDPARGERLKLAREALGLSTGELAAETGTHYMSVWKHEKGAGIRQSVLRKYCERLHVTEEWLAYGVGPGIGGKGAEIVEEYLASPLGKTADRELKRLVRSFPYTAAGVRKLSLQSVHRVREMIETNRILERNNADALQRSRS